MKDMMITDIYILINDFWNITKVDSFLRFSNDFHSILFSILLH